MVVVVALGLDCIHKSAQQRPLVVVLWQPREDVVQDSVDEHDLLLFQGLLLRVVSCVVLQAMQYFFEDRLDLEADLVLCMRKVDGPPPHDSLKSATGLSLEVEEDREPV